jgi:hypothetical protein
MKLKLTALVFLSGALLLRGQGTFVWDQQATGLTDGAPALTSQPMGQPFTPTFSSIDVVAFYLSGGQSDSDIQVNLRSGSIIGTILGTSAPITIKSSDNGPFDFFFSSSIALSPGTQYFLQPEAISGSGVALGQINAPVPTGQEIVNGVTRNDFNFWFQEGVVSNVPEPSLAALLLIGSGVMYCRRRKWRVGKLCNGNG